MGTQENANHRRVELLLVLASYGAVCSRHIKKDWPAYLEFACSRCFGILNPQERKFFKTTLTRNLRTSM